MTVAVEYLLNKASVVEIVKHLSSCNADFVPPLSDRVEIGEYARKITEKALRYEAWVDGILVGLVAFYCNDNENGIAYITNISVSNSWVGKNVAARLMGRCIEHTKRLGMRMIVLEVAKNNIPAIKLYEKNGFVPGMANGPFFSMSLLLMNGDKQKLYA